MNKPIFGKNLFSAKFLKKSVLPFTRRQIRRKYNKITAQKNIWVESDFDFFRFVVCCIQGSIFLSFFFFQNYWSAARLTVTMLHLWRFTTLRPSWGGGESYFISEEQAFFWHRENEHLSNKTGYCYLENTRILYGDANPLKNSSGRHMKWYDSRVRYMVSLSYGNVFHFFTEKPHSAVTQAKRENM